MPNITEIKEQHKEAENRGSGESGKRKILSFSDSPRRPFSDSALLLLHGWATDSRIWGYQLKEFSNDYEVIALNLPGHGSNDKWDEPSLKPAVEKVMNKISDFGFRISDLKSQISNLKSQIFIGIGWSLGGQALLEAAAKMPAYFKALVLIGVSPCFVAKRDFPFGQSAGVAIRMLKDLKKDFPKTMERFYSLNFTGDELLSPEARWFIDLYKNKETTKSFRSSVITTLDTLLTMDLRNIISDIRVPVLIAHGEKDNICPVATGRYLAEHLPNARLEIFKGAGHAPFLTKHKEFNSLVKGFLKGLIHEANQ